MLLVGSYKCLGLPSNLRILSVLFYILVVRQGRIFQCALRGCPMSASNCPEQRGTAGALTQHPYLSGLHCHRCFCLFVSVFFCVCVCGCIGSSLLCMGFLPSCGQHGLLFLVVSGLLIAMASLVGEHELWGKGFSSCSTWAQ